MRARTIVPCLLLLLGTASVAAAQNPFVGTWKLNPAKSQLAGATIKFGPAEGNAIEVTADGASYSFRIDGSPYRMTSGDLAVWKQVDDTTWTTTYEKVDGKPLSTDTWTLSPDGQSLTVVNAGTRPDGQGFSNTTNYARTAGTTGLMGAWKSTDVKLSVGEELVIGEYGLGGLSIKIPSMKASVLAAFGGRDVTPVGPDIPPTLTVALERAGPSSFRLIERLSGAVTYSAVYTVSADGKTMTAVGNARGDPSQTVVWEKQ
jgi:hypothetical protein